MSKHTTNRAGEQLYDMLKDMGWLPYSDKGGLSYCDIGNLQAALANFNGPNDDLNLGAEYRAARQEMEDEIGELHSAISSIHSLAGAYL